MKRLRYSLSLFVLAALALPAAGATYYVDHAFGADTNDGLAEGAGRAWRTLGKATATVAAGDIVYIKAGEDYVEQDGTSGAVLSVRTAGATSNSIRWIGYGTTPGDGVRATLDATENSLASCVNGTSAASSYYQSFRNLELVGGTTAAMNLGSRDYVRVSNCRAEFAGSHGFYLRSTCMIDDSEASHNGGNGINILVASTVANCTAFGNGSYQITVGAQSMVMFCRVWDMAASSYGIDSSGIQAWFINCTADGTGSTGAVGFTSHSGTGVLNAVNCISYNCNMAYATMGGVNTTGWQTMFRNNLAWPAEGGTSWYQCNPSVGGIEADPRFVDPASHDYRLKPDSPARSAGIGGADLGAFGRPRTPPTAVRRGTQ